MALDRFIFYGIDAYTESNLETWITKGVVPLCFSVAEKNRHYTKMSTRFSHATNEFNVFSFEHAQELYPNAEICITVDANIVPKVYKEIYDFIISRGVHKERICPIAKTSKNGSYIFYGAGEYADMNLKQWVSDGIVPLCFVDSNKARQNTKMQICFNSAGMEFEVLPVHDALELYADAFLYISVNPELYDKVYDELMREGIPPKRIGSPPQNCPYVGHMIIYKPPYYSLYDESEFAEALTGGKSVSGTMAVYYEYCEQLRKDLNEGKLTSHTGSPHLRPGISKEEHRITNVYLSNGIPGTTECNFKCFYCSPSFNYGKKYEEQGENILDVIRYFADNEDVSHMYYAAGEITVSPCRLQTIKLLKENHLNGEVFTNGYIYLEELKELIDERNMILNVSIDSGTAETFAKIKGVDGFETVIKNLENYTLSGGGVRLKYIVFEGVNCEKKDLDGFISIACKINALVDISWDCRFTKNIITDEIYEAILYIIKECEKYKLLYCFRYFSKELVQRLNEDGIFPEHITLDGIMDANYPQNIPIGRVVGNV